MAQAHAEYRPRPHNLAHRARRAFIRIGQGGVAEGSVKSSYWQTLAEARVLYAELREAIRQAENAAPPEPPRTEANSAVDAA